MKAKQQDEEGKVFRITSEKSVIEISESDTGELFVFIIKGDLNIIPINKINKVSK